MLMAMSALTEQALGPIANLRDINSYVETSLTDLVAKGLQCWLPRQHAGHPYSKSPPGCVGRSNAFHFGEPICCYLPNLLPVKSSIPHL